MELCYTIWDQGKPVDLCPKITQKCYKSNK